MSKEELLDIIRKILKTDEDLQFLGQLNEMDLRTLVVMLRDRLDQATK